ncbi:Surface surface protein, partial [human gut metagenome]
AYLKSKHLIDNNYFAHDYSGQSFSNLVYSLSGQKINGENIAQNYLTESSYTRSSAQDLANRLFNSWKESSGHNQNMLRESFSSFGFGFE